MSANFNYNYETTSTNQFGQPVPSHMHSLTVGPNGPVLLQDYHLINNLAAFDRERIPERVVHAKGAGAHGYFEVTNDVSKYCKAAFLNRIGKRTPVFVRFSTVGGEKGSADTARDPRGFAVKFYTEEGNYDMVGNNTPVFFVRDSIRFPHFIHTQKREPKSNLKTADLYWDFLSLNPETLHQVMTLFSDRGTPYSYRTMNGYGSHTYKWVNKDGKAFWIKYHFKTEQGVKNFTNDEAVRLAGVDPDWNTRDLYEHIENGGSASWAVKVQVMTYEDASRYRFDPFDVTKVWPHGDYPLIPVGRMVLNRNPSNYFSEVEQSAFSPSNLVPGIEPSPDKMLQGRLFSYPDTQRHRLGANFAQIPINSPLRSRIHTYERDGPMCVTANGGSGPNFYPNSRDGTVDAPHLVEHVDRLSGPTVRSKQVHPNDDFVQPGEMWRKAMNDQDRENFVYNVKVHLGRANKQIQTRQLELFYKADKDMGNRIAKALGLSRM